MQAMLSMLHYAAQPSRAGFLHKTLHMRSSSIEFGHFRATGRAIKEPKEDGIGCEHQKVPIVNTAGADCRADAAVVRDKPGVLGKRAGFPNLDVWRLHHGKPPHGELANPALTIDDDVALVGLARLQAGLQAS